MSAPPQPPARVLTKNSRRPRVGDGQNSSAEVLMSAPRLLGLLHGSPTSSRCAAQMSRPPKPPGRFDAMYSVSPSGARIGQPSVNGVLKSELVPAIDSAFTGADHGPNVLARTDPPESTSRIATTATIDVARSRCMDLHLLAMRSCGRDAGVRPRLGS